MGQTQRFVCVRYMLYHRTISQTVNLVLNLCHADCCVTSVHHCPWLILKCDEVLFTYFHFFCWLNFISLVFVSWCQGSNPGPHSCQASSLPRNFIPSSSVCSVSENGGVATSFTLGVLFISVKVFWVFLSQGFTVQFSLALHSFYIAGWPGTLSDFPVSTS